MTEKGLGYRLVTEHWNKMHKALNLSQESHVHTHMNKLIINERIIK